MLHYFSWHFSWQCLIVRGDTLGQGEMVIGDFCTSSVLTWIVHSHLRPAASWHMLEHPLSPVLWMVWGSDWNSLFYNNGSLFSRCVSRLSHSPSGCHAMEHSATIFLSFLLSTASNQGEAAEHLELQRGSSCWDVQAPRRASLWAAVGQQMENWTHIPFPCVWDDSDISIEKLQDIVREYIFDRWQNIFALF